MSQGVYDGVASESNLYSPAQISTIFNSLIGHKRTYSQRDDTSILSDKDEEEQKMSMNGDNFSQVAANDYFSQQGFIPQLADRQESIVEP